ncbi:MAG: flagellar hook-associated protein FlgK [Defluviitaleaceae bacterium]|nr:flagellar hook-associated protein FlgK [Defluviitaleaceae bacterium]
MRTAFFGLHVATSGLHTARAQLNVTSHNLANAEIPGFSRQVAQMQAGRPLLGTGRGMYGTGSQVTGVMQIRDQFLDRKFWHQNSIFNQFTAKNTHLGFVETVFNQIPNVGVKRTFNGFFSTMQDLTTQAHESTFRTNVITNGHTLTEQIRQNAFALQRQQQDLNREFADVIVTINSLGQQISDLNRQIHIFERDGSNANDLRDQRALLIDQLSGLVNIQVEERDFSRPGLENDRRLTVMINGYDFVDHTRLNTLELVARDNIMNDPRSGVKRNEMDVSGLYDVFFTTTGSRFNIHSSTLSGMLRGIVDVRDGNGGQATMPPVLAGQYLIADQIDALNRSVAFINGLNVTLGNLLTGTVGPPALPSLYTSVNNRNAAFAALNGMPGAGNITTTHEAREFVRSLADHRTRRMNLQTAISNAAAPSHISTLEQRMGLESLRVAMENAGILSGTVASTFNTLQVSLNSVATTAQAAADRTLNIATNADVAILSYVTAALNAIDPTYPAPGFIDQINALYIAVSAELPSEHAIRSTIRNLRDNANGHFAPLRSALQEIASIPNVDTINSLVHTANGHLADINAAMEHISQVTTFPERIGSQLEWAIGNAVDMLALVNRRIHETESGATAGDPDAYRNMQRILEAEIAAMRTLQQNLALDAIDPYVGMPSGGFPQLESFIQSLTSGTSALATFGGHVNNIVNETTRTAPIDVIINGVTYTFPPFPSGASVPVTPTSNFKGIPFYMNQLNHLVRTFARAMNEGRNTDGLEIPGSKGHMFGFDANGENRNALFFTIEDPISGQPGVLVHDDPHQSLRLWILADSAGNPLRENGNLVTIADPNPPANVARDAMGRPMFTVDYSQFNALNFIVNPELLSDPSLLAASDNANIGQANNQVIHGFLAVGNDKSLFREGRLIDFIIATSNHLAVDNNQAYMFRTSYAEVTHQTHNHRLSVKSVDTEEEMMNLVRFQNMFTATSRLINVLDTIYDTLINRLGNF